MVQFHLGENSISFSDDFNKLNTLRTDIIDDMSQFSIYDSMEQLISKHGKMPNIDEVASSFPLMVNQLICEAIVPIIVNFLVENEIYDCSEELFIHRYQERYFNFAKQPQFQNFLSHYVNLANEYMEKRTQKEYNRANRSQWMGGGFGITGAIKGAAQAAVLNAATGVVRGIGDGISDFASSTAYKSKQNSLLSDDVFQEFDIALQNCIHGCILACQIEYSTHKGILCSWSQRENIEKSFAIFNNVQTRVTDTSKIAKLMSTAIELSPYNEEYYSFLYRQDGIEISSSDKIFSKRLKNPTINSPSLFDHLNQALVIGLHSEVQSPEEPLQPKDPPKSDNIFCPYCGKKIPRSSKFCCFCGSKINYKKESPL